MGRGDNRLTRKVRRSRAQKRKKRRIKELLAKSENAR